MLCRGRLLHFHVFPALLPLLQLVRIIKWGETAAIFRSQGQFEHWDTEVVVSARLWFQRVRKAAAISMRGRPEAVEPTMPVEDFLRRIATKSHSLTFLTLFQLVLSEVIVGSMKATKVKDAKLLRVFTATCFFREDNSLLQGAYHPSGWIPSRADSVALCSWQWRTCRGGRGLLTYPCQLNPCHKMPH